MENRCHFFQKHSDFPNFPWVVGHFISVTYCILSLTNSIREIGSSLLTNSTFLIVLFFIFAKVTLKFALSLPVLKKFTTFALFPHFY